MLGRRARLCSKRYSIVYSTHKTRSSIVISPFIASTTSNRRQLSLSSISEPIQRGVESLPNVLQRDIPEAILSFSEAFIPADLPTYTTGIIVFTLLTRLFVVLPCSYWARKRKWRVQEVVNPRLIGEYVHGWGPALITRLKKEGATKAQQRQILAENFAHRKKELEKEFNCSLLPTIFYPALFTIPTFILSTSIFFSAATLPAIASNPLLSETFLLPHDMTPVLPIAIGVVSLLNLEVGTWGPKTIKTMSKTDSADAEVATRKLKNNDDTPQEIVIKPASIVSSFYRAWCIGRAAICVVLPGTVNVFWFTSTLFALVESSIFTLLERGRAPRLWGRNSPLLRLSKAQLNREGLFLSPRSPLERANLVDYNKGPALAQHSGKPQSGLSQFQTKATSAISTTATATSELASKSTEPARRLYSTTVTMSENARDGASQWLNPRLEKLQDFRKKSYSDIYAEYTQYMAGRRERLATWLKEWIERDEERTRRRIEYQQRKIQERIDKANATAATASKSLPKTEHSIYTKRWLHRKTQLEKAAALEAKRAQSKAAARAVVTGLQPPRQHGTIKGTKPLFD